jgi:flagella basal body P-ring formation protein FlgA
MTLLVLFAVAGCLAVDPSSDRIVARDFADAWPEVATLSPDTQLALAPAPGITRAFHTGELRAIADRFRLPLPPAPPSGICFERKTATLDAAVLLRAMQREFPSARIEVLDFSRQPAPQGEIEFSKSGLHPGTGAAMWNGSVRYAGSHRFPIWARVKILATVRRVVAPAPLKPGSVLDPATLVEQIREEFPDTAYAASVDEIAGRTLRRAVAAGEAIRIAWTEPPKLVSRGESVKVEVQLGAARLTLEGVAQAAGSAGDTIPVLNPSSHRTFRGRVAGKSLVIVGGRP